MLDPLRDKSCFLFTQFPLNGITLHAPSTLGKVEAASSRIRVKNQIKLTLFAVNVPKSYTKS